jgi:hypothetical protein
MLIPRREVCANCRYYRHAHVRNLRPTRSDVMYNEGLLAVRAKLKGGKMRYVPMPPELADELRRFMPQPANNVLYIAGNND